MPLLNHKIDKKNNYKAVGLIIATLFILRMLKNMPRKFVVNREKTYYCSINSEAQRGFCPDFPVLASLPIHFLPIV
jgi:hypothetical protein